MSEIAYDDEAFRDAVARIDGGEIEALRALLAEHPHLATSRVLADSPLTRGYFTRPTLLHFVAQNPNRSPHMPPRVVEATAAILDAGAAVDAVTEHATGGTTLALVASSEPAHVGDLVAPLVELLVARGADPSRGLDAAMLHRYAATVELLRGYGAAHTAVTAAGLGDDQALQTLLARGLSDDERLRAGWAAAINGQPAAIERLIDAGLDPSARLPRPFAPTLLHEAALNGHRAVCERLLARGADRALRDTEFGGTPAGWAAHAGHAELAALLC